MRRNFIAVAASDVEYSQHAEKDKLEFRLLSQIMRGARNGLHQGIYAATSSGRFLGQINAGWPEPDGEEAHRRILGALAAYRRMPAGERVLSTQLDARRDRMTPSRELFRRPADVLDLRVVKRSYPFAGMTTFDIRHPLYFALDRLWYRPEEYAAWLPRERRVGASVQVSGPAVQRLISLGHLVQSQDPWGPETIRRAAMTSTLTGVAGERLRLKIAAEFDLKSSTQWNGGSYRGNLLGHAAYDTRARKFVEFELLGLGTHVQSPLRPNMHSGGATSQVGSLITLNPQDDPDDRMLPNNWFYGYPRGWAGGG